MAFLIEIGKFSVEEALTVVRRHPVADPKELQNDGGWFQALVFR